VTQKLNQDIATAQEQLIWDSDFAGNFETTAFLDKLKDF
jgi:hypothetical protein